MTTEEKNEVIHRFMGKHSKVFQVYKDKEPQTVWFNEGEDYHDHYRTSNELEYHSSWDWLMPCCQKLLTEMNNTVYNLRSITEWSNAKRGEIERAIWDYTYSRGTIENVFNELVNAIQWYNNQKP